MMSEESSDTPSNNPPRASRFKEHTNTSNSIRPPPDELWKDLAIDTLIDRFNAENEAPPTASRRSSRNTAPELRRLNSDRIKKMQNAAATVTGGSVSAQPVATGQHEGTFSRLQRAWASMFGNVLGKRKAGAVDAEKDKAQQLLDHRKKAAEIAYHEAKELGLLPTPKVFVRPAMAAMSHNCATPVRTPRTPSLYRTPSKRDLQKQKKLSKRVSNLESKLASARKELNSALYNDLSSLPPLQPVLPPTPPSPATSQDSRDELALPPLEPSRSPPPIPVPDEPIFSDSEPDSRRPSSSRSLGRITKKRKVRLSIDDAEYIPVPTDSEGDMDLLSGTSEAEPEPPLDSERTIKRVKSSASPRTKKAGRRPSTRLQQRGSRAHLRKDKADQAVTVVPDGVEVPLVPAIPEHVRSGKKVVAFEERDGHGGVDADEDMYGGLEHEMF